jgi:hypothetical protein
LLIMLVDALLAFTVAAVVSGLMSRSPSPATMRRGPASAVVLAMAAVLVVAAALASNGSGSISRAMVAFVAIIAGAVTGRAIGSRRGAH